MDVSDERDRLIRLGVAVNGLEAVTARAVRESAARRTTDVYVLGWLVSSVASHCTDLEVERIAADLGRLVGKVRSGGVG
jgi:hypothetical protein